MILDCQELEAFSGASCRELAGWVLLDHEELPTTIAAARSLPAWHAISARRQTAGRGQHERSFVSDNGGVFLSAVVPYSGSPNSWSGFPLVVGWAVLNQLRRWRVREARLRWPNDLLAGDRKLGGILIEQSGPETLVVSLGLNLTNQPWRMDPSLRESATNLASSTATPPVWGEAVGRALEAIRIAHQEMLGRGFAGLLPEISACWGERPRRIELDLGQDKRCEGRFGGVDASGRILVWTSGDSLRCFAPHHVNRLRELPEPAGDSTASTPQRGAHNGNPS